MSVIIYLACAAFAGSIVMAAVKHFSREGTRAAKAKAKQSFATLAPSRDARPA